MNILFVSSIYPPCQQNNIMNHIYKNTDASGDAFQKKIINGLLENKIKNLMLLNVIPVSSFPGNTDLLYVHYNDFEYTRNDATAKGHNVNYINLKLIKRILLPFYACTSLRLFIKKCQDKIDLVVFYAAKDYHNSMYKIIHNMGIKSVLIIPDLPEYSGLGKTGFFQTKYRNYISGTFRKCIRKNVDGLVLLTEQMAKNLQWEKPYIVIEGIAEPVSLYCKQRVCQPIMIKEKYLLYTGSTHAVYGILDAVQAFIQAGLTDCLFVICGEGDADDKIRSISQEHKEIRHLGMVSHKDVLELQRNAYALINPRKNEGEYTKYSFPSKTMEYLSTGLPVIAYMLDGMPREYSEVVISPDDNTITALSLCIKKVMSFSDNQINEIHRTVAAFVNGKKTPKQQTLRIIDFLQNVYNNCIDE